MENYITIDGGTTNTRITLISGREILDTKKYSVGISDAIRDKKILIRAIRDGIGEILQQNGMTDSQIRRIIASGMITSEFGLCCLAHLTTPCGIDELADGLYETEITDISPIPFVFIRGVKTGCDSFETADMMRGEETELLGLCEELEQSSLYVLPGSHSKLIYTDGNGRIEGFSTQLTGELIGAVAGNTVLKGIIDLTQSEIDGEFLQKGYEYAVNNGVSEAFFKVRILKTLFDYTGGQAYSFFIGAALAPEIENIIKSPAKKVIIGGKAQLKIPMAALITASSAKEVITVPDSISDHAAAYGALKIYQRHEKRTGKAFETTK